MGRQQWWKWLVPGLQFKRWLLIALLGFLLALVGASWLVGTLFPLQQAMLVGVALDLLGRRLAWCAGSVCLLTGIVALFWGWRRALRSVVLALSPESGGKWVDILYSRRALKRGPKIVVIGGGTGLSVLLRGLKHYTCNITAIVSVADDGGSSGRLRGEMGILPPGDIRNCLVALADRESLMEQVLQYRFTQGELAGHSLGNLLLAGLCEMNGSFHAAVQGLSRILAVRGRVVPVTLEQVTLGAVYDDGGMVWGESRIPCRGRRIRRVIIKPEKPVALPEAIEAILTADAVVLGPGSLYTSILPNLLVPAVVDALRRTSAVRIYVCNVMTQPGETEGYTAADHVRTIWEHAGRIIDWVIVNRSLFSAETITAYAREGSVPVAVDEKALRSMGLNVLIASLAQEEKAGEGKIIRHHPQRLAKLVVHLALSYRRRLRMAAAMLLLGGMKW